MEQVLVKPQVRTPAELLWNPTSGTFTRGLAGYLVKSGQLENEQSFLRVESEAAGVLGKCLPPSQEPGTRTGLVIGYVQSGKTLSMTAVAAMARDNGFRIIIAISGTTDNLFRQSCERFERDLRGAQSPGAPLWHILENPTQVHARDLQRLVRDWRKGRIQEHQQQALFITVMKNHSHLRNLAALLATEDLGGLDALIIDDEADQASLNTRPNAPSASTTYERIRAIRQQLPRHTYVQYTATAQSIILISLLDMLSPNFADVIEAGEEYVGGRGFFVDRNDLIEEIPTRELPDQVTGDLEPPPSLLAAMRQFFVSAITSPRKANERHRSMLVHPDRRKGIHKSYVQWIEATTDRWGEVLGRDEDDEERLELVEQFRVPYENLRRTAGLDRPFEEVIDWLSVELPRTQITPVNSDGSEVMWDNALLHILVGGQKLDRGYTVKGLVVTYMPRGPGTWTADTIQQRARFFGYKRSYLGWCRVFLEPNLEDLYREYVEHEEWLRREIKDHRGKSTKLLRRAFILDQRYQPTRKNVLTEPFFRAQTGGGWFKQTEPHLPADLDGNTQRLNLLIGQTAWTALPDFRQHSQADVSLRTVLELLGEYAFSTEDVVEAQVTIYHLLRALQDAPDATSLIVRMGTDVRKRSVRDGSTAVEIHQGRSSSPGAGSYPGDAAIRDPDRVTVQIHWVNVVEGDKTLAARAPALAVFIPPNFGQLEWLVQPKAAP